MVVVLARCVTRPIVTGCADFRPKEMCRAQVCGESEGESLDTLWRRRSVQRVAFWKDIWSGKATYIEGGIPHSKLACSH